MQDVLVGGTNTTVITVVWAMTYLMKNPNYLKRAQDEIRQFMKDKHFVNEEDVQNLPYLKAIVKETMRLQPGFPLNPRSTTQDCTLQGYNIPSKTIVLVNAQAIGRDPEAWENFEEFDPDRFIESGIDVKGQHFELVPFGSGRRSCPGIYMGLTMVEVALANLLFMFDWELPLGTCKDDLDFDVLPGMTPHKKNPLLLRARNYVHGYSG